MPAALRMPASNVLSSSICCPGSLLFPLEVEDEHKANDASAFAGRIANLKDRISFLCQPGEAQLALDVRRIVRADCAADGTVDVVAMAPRLSAMGYRVTVRTALGGGAACFRNLRHEFLTVFGEGDYKDVPYIVDPCFKEQFEIPQPTATYAAALELLQPEFVGTASRLVPLVQCLCAEMAASFEAMGLTLPPWRRAQSMLSKWLPSRSRDLCFNDNSSSSPACESVPGSSPAADVAGSSPFSRISDHQIGRQGSIRSLLSGKLTSSASTGSTSSSAGSSRMSSRSFSDCSSSSSIACSQASSNGRSMQSAQQQLGMVSRQPPLYQGQPATYKVKMGAFAAGQQQQPQ